MHKKFAYSGTMLDANIILAIVSYPGIPFIESFDVHKLHFSVDSCHDSIMFTPGHQLNIIA